MKVSLFQQAPYRFMPEGFEDARRAVGRVGPLRGARRPATSLRLVPLVRGRAVGRASRRLRRRRGHRARPDVVRHDAEPEPAGGDPGERDPRGEPRDRADRPRPLAREDARAAADRGGVRDARLPLGRAARRRPAGRAQLRREPEQRHPDRRDEGPLPGGPRPADPVLDLAGAVRLERALLAVRARELLAAAPPAAAPADLGPGRRHAGDDGLDARAELRVRLPQLVRRDADREADLRPLLGAGRPAREAAKPLSNRLRPERRDRGDRRACGAGVRPLRREPLPPGPGQRAAPLHGPARLHRHRGASRRCFAIPATSGSRPS